MRKSLGWSTREIPSKDQSLLPEDLEHLVEDVGDGEFDPDVQQVLEIQHQAGVGQEQLNTQQFEERMFIQ